MRYLSHGLVGGVHTYVARFVPAVLAQADGHQVFLYADAKRPFELTNLPPQVTARILPYRNSLSSLVNDVWMLPRWLARDQVDVAHFPANYGWAPAGAASVITLHDEINLLPWWKMVRGHPKNPRTIGLMTYLHWMSTLSARRAALLLTVSAYAQTQIARYSGLPAARIVPIHHGKDADLAPITDPARLAEARARHGLARPFVLADGLKNPGVLIRAWRLLPPAVRAAHQLAFFARRADVLPVLQNAAQAGEVAFLLRPSRADLLALYSQAAVFAFPSWIEGFGIPVLEAMACGAPTLVSNRGALPEVAGAAAWTLDAEDETAWAHSLTRLLTEPATAADLRQRGLARAAQFSWSATAQHILQAYTHALAAHRAGAHL